MHLPRPTTMRKWEKFMSLAHALFELSDVYSHSNAVV